MLNIENSDIDISQVLTIVNTVMVVGNKGTEFYFLKWRQYILCSEVSGVNQIPCMDCPKDVNGAPAIIPNPPVTFENYWKICIEEEEFLVPKQDGVIEGYLRTPEQQDFKKWKDRFWTNQPKDYKEAAKRILGRDINTGHPDIANQQEYERIKGQENRNNGRNFGSTAKDPEDDPL